MDEGHGPALFHDLRLYGIDLLDVLACRGRDDPRRVMWIVEWLPEGSALQASMAGGPQFRPWTLSNLLSAGSVNALNAGNWQRSGGKGRRPTAIEPPKASTPKVAGRRAERGMRRPTSAGAAMAARAARVGALQPRRALPPSPSTDSP